MLCHICIIDKDTSFFSKDKSKARGFSYSCKSCANLRAKKQYKIIMNDPILKEKMYSHSRSYKKNFKIRRRQQRAANKAKKCNAYVEFVDYEKIYRESDKKCFYCRRELTTDILQFDHYIPFKRGGKHEISNIKISCYTCNIKKNSRLPEIFLSMMEKQNG